MQSIRYLLTELKTGLIAQQFEDVGLRLAFGPSLINKQFEGLGIIIVPSNLTVVNSEMAVLPN